MTKEELIRQICNWFRTDGYTDHKIKDVTNKINEFIELNVVIPRGENRHPYATVLHEWIEGNSIIASEDGNHFHDVSSAKSRLGGKYYSKKHINSIFEYQWYTVFNGLTHLDNKFYTLQEMIDFGHDIEWKKIEETKRVRNA